MPSEHGETSGTTPTRKFLGMYRGVVVDNEDPKKMGRCRIRIGGVYPNDGGPWAFPIGQPGAGSAARGIWAPPAVGSDVCVWFEQGDIDHPYFMGGNPGREEVPEEVRDGDTTPAEAVKVAAWETERWRIKLDSRDGRQEMHIQDKATGDVIELDGVKLGVRIKGTSAVLIESDVVVNVDAPEINLGGRRLTKNGKPIN